MKRKATVWMAAALAAVSTAVITPDPAFAVEKIRHVSVEIKIEGYDEYGYPEIEVETRSSASYSCGSAELESENMDDAHIAKIVKSASEENYIIELSANDGYAFYLTRPDQAKLKGAGAKLKAFRLLDNRRTLRLTFQLAKLEDVCSPVEQAVWHDDGTASWDPAYNAVQYKLVLSRNYGNSKVYYTGGTSYDFKPVMLREGAYGLKVYPLSRSGKSSGYAEAGTFYVTQEMASAYSKVHGVEMETRKLEGIPDDGPGTVEVITKNTGWKQDDDGWWYQNEDGTYLQYDWTELGGDWYFFGSDGYMVTDKVIRWGNNSYYMAPDGKMAVNRAVPDGRRAGPDGILTGKMNIEYVKQAIDSGEMEKDDENYGPGFRQ